MTGPWKLTHFYTQTSKFLTNPEMGEEYLKVHERTNMNMIIRKPEL